ncbi:hypothetical protein ABXV03_10555 [Streptomyces harbinensis]|uniref:scabin-related ADP-ribosyltransferase n=1 Tax=Streptomyces harbinensis TaxID=1176198 RepID=UPI003399504C
MSEEMCVPETGDVDRIDPAGIPEFTGNLAMLAADCMGFDAAATRVRTIGSDVHDEFQGLSSFYTAPEAEQLFATTAPARDRAADFADDLATVRSALWDYHQEITPLVGRLRRLKHEAEEFVASIRDDDDWKKSESKVDRNNELLTEVSTTVARFWAAERACANRINALWGGPQWTTDDGSGGTRMYGVSEEEMAQAGETPWGRAVEREYHWYRFDQHIKSFVWDGIIVDGIWGSLVGLSSLVGLQGWDAMKASWNGLAQLVVGLSITINPLGHYAVDLMPDGTVKNWLTDAQDLTIETAKGLVAWDTWSEDPARAAGLTTFNILTTVATFGAGAGVRAAASGAGTASRIAATTARIGTAIDIPGHIVTGLTQLNRLSQITDDLARLTAAKGFDLPDGTTQLPNGTVVHPGRPYEIDPPHQATRKPDGTLLLPDGRTLHPDGRLTSPTGDTLQTPDQIPAELSARDRTILDNTTHDPVAVGAPQKPDLNAQANATPQQPPTHHADTGSPQSPGESRTGGTGPGNDPAEGPPGNHTPESHGGTGGSSYDGGGHDSGSSSPSGSPGEPPDRLAAATNRNIDLDNFGIPPVWREGSETLYRNDNRSPDVIFEDGFEPLDPTNTDLKKYVEDSEPSAFVSTSYREDIGDEFGGKFTYVVDVPGGIDINRTIGDHPLSYEEEVAFPGGIRSEYIKGAHSYNYATGELGEFIPNPNYIPEARRVE